MRETRATNSKETVLVEEIINRYQVRFPDKAAECEALKKQLQVVVDGAYKQKIRLILFGVNNVDGIGDYKHLVDYYQWMKDIFRDNEMIEVKGIVITESSKLKKLSQMTSKAITISYFGANKKMYSDPDLSAEDVKYQGSDVIIISVDKLPENMTDFFNDCMNSNDYLKGLFTDASMILNISSALGVDFSSVAPSSALIHSRLEYESRMRGGAREKDHVVSEDSMGISPGHTGIKIMDYQGHREGNVSNSFQFCGYLQGPASFNAAMQLIANSARSKRHVKMIIPMDENRFNKSAMMVLAREQNVGVIERVMGDDVLRVEVDSKNDRTLTMTNFSGLSNEAIADYQKTSDVIACSGDNSFSDWVSYGGIPFIKFPQWKSELYHALVPFFPKPLIKTLGQDREFEFIIYFSMSVSGSDYYAGEYLAKNYAEILKQSNIIREEIFKHHNAREHFIYLLEAFTLKCAMQHGVSNVDLLAFLEWRDKVIGVASDNIAPLAHTVSMSYGRIGCYAALAGNMSFLCALGDRYPGSTALILSMSNKWGVGNSYVPEHSYPLTKIIKKSAILMEINPANMTKEESEILKEIIESRRNDLSASNVIEQGIILKMIGTNPPVVVSLSQSLVFYESVKHPNEFRTCVYDAKSAPLGRGWFGLVYKVSGSLLYNKHGELTFKSKELKPRVIKVIDLDEARAPITKENIIQEERFMSEADFHSKKPIFTSNKAYTILKQFKGVPLNKLMFDLTKKGPHEKLTVIVNLLQALKNLHSKGLIHRDIKPSNIILNPEDYSVAIVDMGSASRTPEKINLGEPGFLAPEVRSGSDVNDDKSDVYSMGAVISYIVRNDRGNKSSYMIEDHDVSMLIASLRSDNKSDRDIDAALATLEKLKDETAPKSISSQSSVMFPAQPSSQAAASTPSSVLPQPSAGGDKQDKG